MSRLPTLTVGQRDALPEVLSLLELQDAKLSPTKQAALCRKFHSIPYQDRKDVELVRQHLMVAMKCLNALARAESMATITESNDLAELVSEIERVVKSLDCSESLGATS